MPTRPKVTSRIKIVAIEWGGKARSVAIEKGGNAIMISMLLRSNVRRKFVAIVFSQAHQLLPQSSASQKASRLSRKVDAMEESRPHPKPVGRV